MNLQISHSKDEKKAVFLTLRDLNLEDEHSRKHHRVEVRNHAQCSDELRKLRRYNDIGTEKMWVLCKPIRVVLLPQRHKGSARSECQNEEGDGVGDDKSDGTPDCPSEFRVVCALNHPAIEHEH